MKRQTIIILFLLITVSAFSQRTVRYDLYINDTIVNYSGKDRHAISINGSIPAPTLNFTEGDTAEIYVHNNLNEETSIHWHGLILPNSQDGVPYLTTAPIKAHTTYKYSFPLLQSGTLWYHSHTKLQEQSGMYGAFIIHKRNEKPMPEYVMVLSDWTNERPYEVDRSLHSATDWYAIKKNSTQDYWSATKNGYLGTKFKNEWKRMLAMDVSDVYYDRLFINGKTDDAAPQFKPGEKVRLRIINGGSSTYFWLNYGGGKMTVVATDGVDVEPVEVDRMIIAVSETYDVIITIPPDGISNEFTATAEDRTKHASLWLGNGIRQLEMPMPRLKYFEGMKMMNNMMTLGGDMKPMGMAMHDQIMDMNTVMYPEITGEPKKKEKPDSMGMSHAGHSMNKTGIVTLNYTMLKSPTKTTLPYDSTRTMHFELTGNMNRYVWTIDNKTVSEADKILIKKGENIRIIIYNNSMMRHPMHLHGHYFRLLNGQGEYSPLKNIIDIMPMETDTIEFAATESGDWFFHCHILYHMMSGMGRIFSYVDSPPNPEIPNPKKSLRKLFRDDRMLHPMGQISLESNGSDGEFMFMNTRWFIQTEWRLGINSHHGYESESHIGRYFGKMQFFRIYTGWDYRYRINLDEPPRNLFGQGNSKDRRQVVCFGIQYVLPFLILADFRVDQTGRLRLQLEREDIPVTKRLRLGWMVNSDFEYMAGARYILTKYFSVSTHYDSDMGWGGGITVTY